MKYKKIAEVKDSEMEYIFADDWYDWALKGLCRYENKIQYFVLCDSGENREWIYAIYELSPIQRVQQIINKKLFEFFVDSIRYSFDKNSFCCCGGEKPKWMRSLYFKLRLNKLFTITWEDIHKSNSTSN